MTKNTVPTIQAHYFHPRNWGAWLLIGLMYSLSLLPMSIQHYLGLALGRLGKKILKSRVRIARRNLELSFPDKSQQEREQILNGCFDNMGHAIFGTSNAWFWSRKRFERAVEVEGLEHLQTLREQPGGILLVSLHFWTLESHARAYGLFDPGVGIYRPNRNPVYEYFQYHGRVRSNKYLVQKKDVRGMIKALREQNAVWYAPDHDYGGRASVFVPLFAQPEVATVTGTATLAKVKNARLLVTYALRKPKGGFKLVIEPALENYPVGDDLADARFINEQIERVILQAPEQYMWIHRRFKTRPKGQDSLY